MKKQMYFPFLATEEEAEGLCMPLVEMNDKILQDFLQMCIFANQAHDFHATHSDTWFTTDRPLQLRFPDYEFEYQSMIGNTQVIKDGEFLGWIGFTM